MGVLPEQARTDVLHWPGMRSEYAWIPAGEHPTRTKPGQVGVSFSAHRGLVYETADRVTEADIAGGSVFVTGPDPVTWLHVGETTEALEVYPDMELLRALAGTEPELQPAAAARDGTVLAICSVLKQAHATGGLLSDMAASTLAHRLAEHLLTCYCHPRYQPERSPGRLGRKIIDRVSEYVDAGLPGTLSLDRLARVAGLSPFHFARAFKAATGLSPHRFVIARRMHRATALLTASPMPVAEVAAAVGLSNVSYFRRSFRREMGVLPSELRQNSKIGPCAARRLMPASDCDSYPTRFL
jgi:AraC family transcriptional regulator